MSELSLWQVPGMNPTRDLRDKYNAIYDHWRAVWGPTFSELDGSETLYSDEFTRQDYIIGLFLKSECIAAICYRKCDLSLPATRKDSYFKIWPEDAIGALADAGPVSIIGSQISVAQEARQLQFNNWKVKTILSFVFLFQMEKIKADAITGTMRADKGMHDLFYGLGALPLKKDCFIHGVPVDLVGFFPKRSPLIFPDGAKAFAAELWRPFEMNQQSILRAS